MLPWHCFCFLSFSILKQSNNKTSIKRVCFWKYKKNNQSNLLECKLRIQNLFIKENVSFLITFARSRENVYSLVQRF